MCNLLYNLINISTSCIIIDKSNIIKQLLNASMCRPMEVFLGLKEPFFNYFCFLKFNPFHATDRFWYHLKKSENLRFFYVFWGYQKRSVAWNWLFLHKALLLVHCGSCFFLDVTCFYSDSALWCSSRYEENVIFGAKTFQVTIYSNTFPALILVTNNYIRHTYINGNPLQNESQVHYIFWNKCRFSFSIQVISP